MTTRHDPGNETPAARPPRGVLVLTADDGDFATLRLTGVEMHRVDDVASLVERIDDATDLLVLDEGALRSGEAAPLVAWLGAQPAWSDLPLIAIGAAGAAPLGPEFGNVTQFDRPISPGRLRSLVQAAQRARARQRSRGAGARARSTHGDERMQAILDNDAVGIAQIDSQGRFELANAYFRRLVQRDAAALTGLTLFDITAAEERDGSRRRLEAMFAAGHSYGGETLYLRPDGSTVWADIQVSPVHHGGGTARSALAIVQDVTARRQAEARLRLLTETLEAQVVADTDKLRGAETALAQSLKMEAVGRLTGGIAHDFNNLLTAIVGSLELLQKRVADEPRSLRLASAAFQAALRGVKLTGQLLAFSRVQKLDLQTVDVNAIILGAHALLQRTLGPSITVALALEPELELATADANQLELALLNLALNARDAMPQGGTLTIRTARRSMATADSRLERGGYVAVGVQDSGSGMSPDVLARALEPFFTTKKLGQGTGLGLSQVYGIARQSGGDLEIVSTPEAGTTVQLLMPVAHAASAIGPRDAPGVTGRVLVVDDDADVRGTFSEGLEDHGFTVTQAADGPSALLALESGLPFDVALIDFAMPVMNGAAVAKAMLTLQPDLPIVFASGYAETAALNAFPGTPVLRKPVRLSELAQTLGEAMRQKSMQRPLCSQSP